MKSEKWKPVTGFESLYAVSDKGRVKSFDRTIYRKDGSVEVKKGRIMKQSVSAQGYLIVSLCNQCMRTIAKVHRLVAVAFIGPANDLHVNHIDCNKKHNASVNLEWVTPQQNTAHSIGLGRWNGLHKNKMILAAHNPRRAVKLSADDVAEIRAACSHGEPQHAIATRYGITQASVSRIKRGVSWSNEVCHGANSKALIAHIAEVSDQFDPVLA